MEIQNVGAGKSQSRLLALVHEKTTSERLNNVLEVTEWGQDKKI